MSKPRYDGCESGIDFERAALKSEHVVKVHRSGDHTTIWGPTDRVTLCASRYEYCPHVRRKIMRELVAAGLTVLAVAVIIILI